MGEIVPGGMNCPGYFKPETLFLLKCVFPLGGARVFSESYCHPGEGEGELVAFSTCDQVSPTLRVYLDIWGPQTGLQDAPTVFQGLPWPSAKGKRTL